MKVRFELPIRFLDPLSKGIKKITYFVILTEPQVSLQTIVIYFGQ